MRASRFLIVALASALVVLLSVTNGSAGGVIDPNEGDTLLGRKGGVRYASDQQPFDMLSDAAEVEVGCGGQAWQVIGGGSVDGGAAATSWQTSDRPTDSSAEMGDIVPDDGWRAGGVGQSPAQLTGFSACVRDADLRYRSVILPAGTSGNREGSIGCAGAAWHVTSGSVFIATTGSWVHDSYPWDGPDADQVPDDGWQGGVWDANGGGGLFAAYAICARGEDLRYVQKGPFAVDPGSAHRHTVACRPDEHVVGGGARLGGPESVGRMLANHPSDRADADDVPDDAWTSRVYNLSGVARQVTAFAVCLG